MRCGMRERERERWGGNGKRVVQKYNDNNAFILYCVGYKIINETQNLK